METYQIINGIIYYGCHSLDISPQTGNLLSRQIFKNQVY